MGTLAQHNTMIPTAGMDASIPVASTGPKDSGGKLHDEPRGAGSKGAGGGLPNGKLDTRRSPQI